MANDLNKWMGIGRLGKDPEMRYTSDGKAIASLSIACGESWKDKTTGEKQEKTEWVRIVAFGKLAEIIGEWLKKGAQVYIEGKLQTRKWQDKEGIDRYTTEIVADRMQMLGSRQQDGDERPSGAPSAARTGQTSRAAGSAKPAADFDDDIPF